MNPILALIIANSIWGAASPIFKLALTNIPPFTLAFVRFFFAGLVFLPFVVTKWQKMTRRDFFEIFLVAIFGTTVNISFFFLGLQKTASINAPVIASAGPVFIYFLSVLFLQEKPSRRVFYGMMIALTGVLIIIFSPIFFEGQKFACGEIEGNFFFVIATLGSVLQTIFGKEVLRRIRPIQVTFISFIIGSLTFIPLIDGELTKWSFSMLSVNGWLGIIFGVFLSSAVAYWLYYYGISKIKAQESGIFSYIDPVIAVIIAIPLLGEYPNAYFFAGSVLVFGGILLAEKRLHWHPFHKLRRP